MIPKRDSYGSARRSFLLVVFVMVGLVSCAIVGRWHRGVRPDGNIREMPEIRREPAANPHVKTELLGAVDVADSPMHLKSAGNALYASLGHAGLAVYDLADPTHPILTTQLTGMLGNDNPDSRIISRTYPELDRKRLVVMDRIQGLSIYDAEDPLRPQFKWQRPSKDGVVFNPVSMARVGNHYYFGCGGAGLLLLPANFDSVTTPVVALRNFDHTRDVIPFPPHYLLVADGYDTGFQTLDISEPTSPTVLHLFQTMSYCDQVLPLNKRYVALNNRKVGVTFVDMSDPMQPFIANQWTTLSGNVAVKIMALWRDRYLFVGCADGIGNGFIEVFDVRKPAQPVVEIRIETQAEVNALELRDDMLYAGLWGKKKIAVYRLTEIR